MCVCMRACVMRENIVSRMHLGQHPSEENVKDD
jgi:hypothetical protein